MKTACLACLACLIPFLLLADTLTTVAGKTYYDIEVISNRCDLFSITFKHRAGTAKLAYAEMTEVDKVKHGYKPNEVAKVKAEQLKQRQHEAENAKRLQQEQEESAKENEAKMKRERLEKEQDATRQRNMQRYEHVGMIGGIPYDFTEPRNAVKRSSELLETNIHEAERITKPYLGYLLSGTVIQVLPDGLLVDCKYHPLLCGYDETVFVADWYAQDAVVDGSKVTSMGLLVGRYQYINTMGANKTVFKFVCARKPKREITASEIKPLPVASP